MTTLGAIFPPNLPPEQLREVAGAADESGLQQLWLWEDCFAESGIASAAAILGWTDRVAVGIGLLPVPLRNVALTAMELATLARLFPGRIVPGIGHGVLDWMGQVGARAESPMTLLREYTLALHELLAGETVTSAGRYVRLSDVTLTWPPAPAPPILLGAVGAKTLRLAGEVGDGVILVGDTSLEAIRAAATAQRDGRVDAGRDGDGEVVAFLPIADWTPPDAIAARVGQHVDAGATTVALLSVGDDAPPLAEFVGTIGREVQPSVP